MAGTSAIVVAALGDSITAGSPGWDPDPRARRRIPGGGDPRSQWEFWAARADPRLEFRNCGVYGERAGQIAARLDGCVGGADVLVVQGGINDVVQRRPVEQAAENFEGMLARGRAAGLSLAVTDVLPWNNGDARAAEAIVRLNALIAELATSAGATLLPFHDTLVDAADPRRMGDGLSNDGDHPSIEGHRLLGEAAFRL
jgi:lysophospholipase L1-like esterase